MDDLYKWENHSTWHDKYYQYESTVQIHILDWYAFSLKPVTYQLLSWAFGRYVIEPPKIVAWKHPLIRIMLFLIQFNKTMIFEMKSKHLDNFECCFLELDFFIFFNFKHP